MPWSLSLKLKLSSLLNMCLRTDVFEVACYQNTRLIKHPLGTLSFLLYIYILLLGYLNSDSLSFMSDFLLHFTIIVFGSGQVLFRTLIL